MFLNSATVVLILSLFIGAKATASQKCAWLIGSSRGQEGRSYYKHLINMRVESIKSASALSEILILIGEFNSANYNGVKEMSDLIFKELGEFGAKRIVRNLMLIHRHQAQEGLFSALLGYMTREAREARTLELKFRRPFDEDTFLRWMQLGEGIITNRSFIGNLEIAIDDFLQFEPALRNYIDTKLTQINLIDGLKKLKSASLVGQFMDIFLKADPVTRQYIFSEIIDLKYGVDGERTIALKGTSTPGEKFGVDEAISRLLRKTLEILQEEAFFMYESSGDSRRPPLSKAKEKKAAALRFLNRKKYDLTDFSVRYAVGILAEHPRVDDEVDMAMKRVLEIPNVNQHLSFVYAEHELLILQRSARGLSVIEPDLHYTFLILSRKTDCLMYLKNLLIFHQKFGLETYPKLKEIVVKYFRGNPSSFSDLLETGDDIKPAVEKFLKDFHISEP